MSQNNLKVFISLFVSFKSSSELISLAVAAYSVEFSLIMYSNNKQATVLLIATNCGTMK